MSVCLSCNSSRLRDRRLRRGSLYHYIINCVPNPLISSRPPCATTEFQYSLESDETFSFYKIASTIKRQKQNLYFTSDISGY